MCILSRAFSVNMLLPETNLFSFLKCRSRQKSLEIYRFQPCWMHATLKIKKKRRLCGIHREVGSTRLAGQRFLALKLLHKVISLVLNLKEKAIWPDTMSLN